MVNIQKIYSNGEFLRYPAMVDAMSRAENGEEISIKEDFFEKKTLKLGCLNDTISFLFKKTLLSLKKIFIRGYRQAFHHRVNQIQLAYNKKQIETQDKEWRTKEENSANKTNEIKKGLDRLYSNKKHLKRSLKQLEKEFQITVAECTAVNDRYIQLAFQKNLIRKPAEEHLFQVKFTQITKEHKSWQAEYERIAALMDAQNNKIQLTETKIESKKADFKSAKKLQEQYREEYCSFYQNNETLLDGEIPITECAEDLEMLISEGASEMMEPEKTPYDHILNMIQERCSPSLHTIFEVLMGEVGAHQHIDSFHDDGSHVTVKLKDTLKLYTPAMDEQARKDSPWGSVMLLGNNRNKELKMGLSRDRIEFHNGFTTFLHHPRWGEQEPSLYHLADEGQNRITLKGGRAFIREMRTRTLDHLVQTWRDHGVNLVGQDHVAFFRTKKRELQGRE